MGLFRRGKPTSHPQANVDVWIVGLHIRAGAENLPPPMAGAYVSVFCGGDNATCAAWAAIQAIEAMGYSVPDNPRTVHLIRACDYEAYVASNWPELAGELVTQTEFYERIAGKRIVLGPFGGYEDPPV